MRTAIVVTVHTVGWLLGGTVGVGTVVYAFGIGPLMQLFVRLTPARVLAVSGWARVHSARRGADDGAVRPGEPTGRCTGEQPTHAGVAGG